MRKNRIFITSTGRTGTQFFAKYLSKFVENSESYHEPGTPWFSKPQRTKEQLKNYGLYHLTLGQLKNSHSFYKLSRDYITGEISKKDALIHIKDMQGKMESLNDADVYIHSSGHIYGLLDLFDELYQDAKFVFVIRDPRTWIVSAMEKTEYTLYGPIEIFFKKLSLQAAYLEDDPYKDQWHKMTKFEKYCWYYNKLNEIAIESMKGKSNFRVFKYEDLFLSHHRGEHFEEMLYFATDFKNQPPGIHFNPVFLSRREDSQQKKKTVGWEGWHAYKAKLLYKHCGKWMKTYGYGQEELWKDMIGFDYV